MHGRAVTLPPEYGDGVLWFGKVFSVDIVDVPLGGGPFIQSDAAETTGLPWPVLPKMAPLPRPAREGVGWPRRHADTRPLETAFRVLRPGEDY